MTYEFQYLMHLLGAASRGTSAKPPNQEISWNRVLELSQEQMLNPIIGYALKKNTSLGCPEDLAKKLVRESVLATVTECGRRGLIIFLLEEMERNGIHVFVVKGFSAAAVYASPETRISADTDICIAPEDEHKASEFLKNHGFEISGRWKNGHHFEARHPQMGLVEVHVRLYDEIVEDVWFAEVDAESLVCNPHQKVHTQDGDYFTLDDTDLLIFMVLHMVKHFISCGMSLRMMMDVALFMSAKKNEVDFDRLWSVMKRLRYDMLLSTVIHAMVEYCGFDAEDFRGIGLSDSEKINMLLDDVEKGGWLGKNNIVARKESGKEYNRLLIMKNKSRLSYWIYMFRWQNSLKLKTFFPPVKAMVKKYPCLDKFPWLLPFAWLHRLLFRSFRKSKETKKQFIFNEQNISDESKKRVEMFDLLGML